MSQYSSPGVQKQNQGADFRGTPGLHIPTSGGVSTKAVAYSELSDAQAAIDATIAALEASLNAVDTTLQSEINGLALGLSESAVNALIQTALVGGVRYRGVALADETDAAAATGFSAFATGDMFRISSGGSSAFGFALSIGDFVIRNASNGWDKIDSTDPSLAAADSSITVTQTGANSYTVKIATAITDRIIAAESAIATLQTGLAAAVTVNTAQAASITAIEGVNTAQSSAITTLGQGLDAAIAVNATQTSAIAAIETVNNTQSSAISALVTDLAAAVAVNTDQNTSIVTLEASLASTDASLATADAAIGALQADNTDNLGRLDNLENEIVTRASRGSVRDALISLFEKTRQVIVLNHSSADQFRVVTDEGNGIIRTEFYNKVPDCLSWAVVEVNEFAAPYEQISPSKHEKVSTAPGAFAVSGTQTGFFMKFTFWGGLAVPVGTIQVYLLRFSSIGNEFQDPSTFIPELPSGSA